MPYYVDIGAVGIQRYLARSRRLDGRRAASASLVAATSELDVADVLSGRAERNAEAGSIDGVLSLKLHDPAEREDVIDTALAAMRDKLPAAEFQVVEAEAPDYLHALTDTMQPAIDRGQVRLDLPAPAEFPGALRCQMCGSDTAVSAVYLGEDDGKKNACADCTVRHAAPRSVARTAEQRLAEKVRAERVGGFDELAGFDGHDQHLATVYADANKLGRFFREITAQYDAAPVPKAAAAVSEATFAALVEASLAIRPGTASPLWVLPHIVGGDDVLVTVPARRGWKFARTFIAEFRSKLAAALENAGVEAKQLPTVSGGLVFMQKNHTFADVVEIAETCLKTAKSTGAGERECLCYHDAVAATGSVFAVEVLQNHQRDLEKLHRTPTAHRRQLDEALRSGGPEGARALATRLGRSEVVAPFLPTASTTPAIDLHQALSMARRWSW